MTSETASSTSTVSSCYFRSFFFQKKCIKNSNLWPKNVTKKVSKRKEKGKQSWQKYLLLSRAQKAQILHPHIHIASEFTHVALAAASTEMGGAAAAAAVALLAATRRRPAAGPLAFLLPRAARAGFHEAAAPAAEEKGRTRRRRRRRSSSSRLLGPDIPDTWDSPPRAAARPPPPSGAGGNRRACWCEAFARRALRRPVVSPGDAIRSIRMVLGFSTWVLRACCGYLNSVVLAWLVQNPLGD